MNEKQRNIISQYREAVRAVFAAPSDFQHAFAVFAMMLIYTEARVLGVFAYQLHSEYETIEELYNRRN